MDLDVPQEQWDKLAKLCDGESDRGAVLMAAAYVEALLELALRERLVDRGRVAMLFDPMGPLDSLSAKIGVAFGIGLLTDHDARDLDLIKDIRNDFAHSLDELTFDDPRIRSLCNQFTLCLPADADLRRRFFTAVGFAAHVTLGMRRTTRLESLPVWSESDPRFVNLKTHPRYSQPAAKGNCTQASDPPPRKALSDGHPGSPKKRGPDHR